MGRYRRRRKNKTINYELHSEWTVHLEVGKVGKFFFPWPFFSADNDAMRERENENENGKNVTEDMAGEKTRLLV